MKCSNVETSRFSGLEGNLSKFDGWLYLIKQRRILINDHECFRIFVSNAISWVRYRRHHAYKTNPKVVAI